MTGTRRPTITDVAAEAGVSRAAVSKVIRHAYGVSPAMRARVEAAIESLGYRPSTSARSLRGRSFTIGIEVPELGNPFIADVVRGSIEALASTDYQIIIAPAEQGPEEGRRAIEVLADRGVEGIITVSPAVDVAWLEALAARLPVVMVGRHDPTGAYDTVTGDDLRGAREIMEHLLASGHRRIAHLTRADVATTARTPHGLRLAGYRASLREHGLSALEQIVRCGPAEEDAHGAAAALLSGPDRPTAIFAGNDELAFGAQRAAAELGLGPDRLALAGYDDVAMARHPGVSLTSVAQPADEMGRRAVELLRERLDGRTEAVHHVVDVRMIVRSSTLSPAAGGDPRDASGDG